MNACMYDKKDEHLREKNINFSQVFTFKRKGLKKRNRNRKKKITDEILLLHLF